MAKIIVYNLTSHRNVGTEETPEWEEYEGFECSIPYSELAEEIAKKEAYNGEYTIEEVDDEELPTASPSLETRVDALEADQADIAEALDMILSGVTE